MGKKKKVFNWGFYLDSLSTWAMAIGLLSAFVILLVNILSEGPKPGLGPILLGLLYASITVLGTLFLHGILKGLSILLKTQCSFEPEDED